MESERQRESLRSRRAKDFVSSMSVRSMYSEELRQRDKDLFPFNYLVVRPLSFPVAAWFIRRGISATQVTFIGMWLLLVGFTLFAAPIASLTYVTGNTFYFWALAGAVLINAWFFLDDVDGNIARYTKTSSPRGALVDTVTGQLYHVFSPVFVGLHLWLTTSPEGYQTIWYLVAGLLLGVIISSRIGISRTISLKIPAGPDSGAYNKPSLVAWFGYILQSIKAPLLLIAAFIRILPLWLMFVGLLESILYIRTLARAYRKG